MLTDEERADLARAVQTMQIIVGALAAGVVFFLVVVLVLAQQQPGPPPNEPRITYIAVVVAFVAFIVALIFPGIILRSQRQAILAKTPTPQAGSAGGPPLVTARDLGPLVAGYQTSLIIRSALLEGAAFFCLVAYMLERQTLSLVVAGVMLLFLLSKFPTRSKLEGAIENEWMTIEQLRQMGPTDAR